MADGRVIADLGRGERGWQVAAIDGRGGIDVDHRRPRRGRGRGSGRRSRRRRSPSSGTSRSTRRSAPATPPPPWSGARTWARSGPSWSSRASEGGRDASPVPCPGRRASSPSAAARGRRQRERARRRPRRPVPARHERAADHARLPLAGARPRGSRRAVTLERVGERTGWRVRAAATTTRGSRGSRGRRPAAPSTTRTGTGRRAPATPAGSAATPTRPEHRTGFAVHLRQLPSDSQPTWLWFQRDDTCGDVRRRRVRHQRVLLRSGGSPPTRWSTTP